MIKESGDVNQANEIVEQAGEAFKHIMGAVQVMGIQVEETLAVADTGA